MSDPKDLLLLWRRFVTGDSQAFSMLYREEVQLLFSYGMQFTQDSELVKDCIHDVFVKLYKNRDRLGEVTNVRVYFYIVFKNVILDELGKRGRMFYVEDVSEDMDDTKVSSVEEHFVEEEKETMDNKRINNLLNSLSPRQREVVYLRFIENMDIKDIADVMKMKYQSVENLLQRSILKARKMFLGILFLLLIEFF